MKHQNKNGHFEMITFYKLITNKLVFDCFKNRSVHSFYVFVRKLTKMSETKGP